MKKNSKRILSLLTALTIATGLTACKSKGTVIDKIDTSKSQLKIFNFDGGVGTEWLDKVIARFEEDYKDYSFEPGKKGVQFQVDASKSNALETMNSNDRHIVFSEVANYGQLVNNNELCDITDILDKPLSEVTKTTDTQTLRSKMYRETIDFYSFKGNKVYALPHYSFFSALTYNRQLFENKNLYFKDGYDASGVLDEKFVHNKNDVKSCGPDGVKGTDDDGLPATYDELFDLFNCMKDRGVTPLIWSGKAAKNGGYINYILNAVYLSLAGKDDAKVNYTFDSGDNTITVVESFNGNEPVTKEEKITQTDYRKMNSELAKYRTMQVVDKIIDTENWQDESCRSETTEMLQAQQNYIESYNMNKPIGILVDGSYWYNEADEANFIEDTASRYTDYDEKNDYRVFPMPRVYSGTYADVEGTSVGKTVYADQADSIAVISAKNVKGNAAIETLAKTFLAYCYTAESLEEFTVTTRVTRSLKYSVDETKLDDWGKEIWNYTSSSDLLLPYAPNDVYFNNKLNFSMHIDNDLWEANGRSFYNYCKGSATAKDFFNVYKNR